MILLYFIVALGGALGAISRYATVLFAQNLWGMRFPYGTLLVNTIGSFVAGFFLHFFVARYNAGEHLHLFFVVGFLGAYTTFSSFAAETLILFEEGQWLKMGANILLNNIGSLTMVLMGTVLARYLALNYFSQN